MKNILAVIFSLFIINQFLFSQISNKKNDRSIDFRNIPGYFTLKCDLHQHTVFSDGNVWPSIRVEEANKDGLDAISLTEHLEYQPHKADMPHKDRNRAYHVAKEKVDNNILNNLIVINGAEITREMPPGHSNAIFIEDANKLMDDDPIEVFREANRQNAFVFWNHPHWVAQQSNGIATLNEMHHKLLDEGLLHGIEVVNADTYSDEALQIAIDHNLTILGNSDIHGLIDWRYNIPNGGHRPITMVFAKEKNEAGLKDGLVNRRTVVWFNNTLIGRAEFLVPLIKESIKIEDIEIDKNNKRIQTVVPIVIKNNSDADFILKNETKYSFQNGIDVITAPAHSQIELSVKTRITLSELELKFKVLNCVTAPNEHPEVEFNIKINRIDK